MTNYVFVHGSWHAAWCWEKIVPLLEEKGHQVWTVELPGNGTDNTPADQVTLAGGVDKTCEAIDQAREPVVLVGHSMGGVTVSQAAEYRAEKIKSLVYVASFLLKDGQSLLNIPTDEAGLLAPNMIPSEDGTYVTVREELLTDIFYGCCSTEDAERAKQRLYIQSLGPLPTPLTLSEARYGSIPRYYIECLQDRAITPRSQREMYTALPCTKVYSLNTDHSPFYSTPSELASILLEIGEL